MASAFIIIEALVIYVIAVKIGKLLGRRLMK